LLSIASRFFWILESFMLTRLICADRLPVSMANPAGLLSAALTLVGIPRVAPAIPMVLVSPWVPGVQAEKSRVLTL
jgi:hypothetical protein